jgi:hypothetical protein
MFSNSSIYMRTMFLAAYKRIHIQEYTTHTCTHQPKTTQHIHAHTSRGWTVLEIYAKYMRTMFLAAHKRIHTQEYTTHTRTHQPWMDQDLFPSASNCTLGINSWPELVKNYDAGNLNFTTGSLGQSKIKNVYLAWVCVQGYQPWLSRYTHTYVRRYIHA